MLLTRTFLAFLALSLTACETRVSKHGMIPSDDELALIKPGVHKRGDIRVILGPPSTIAEFEPKAWYYIGSEIQKEAFSKSRLLVRKITEVRFDSQGFVTVVKSFDTSEEGQVTPVERKTPTAGKKLTIIQQLIGNAGRFIGTDNEANISD